MEVVRRAELIVEWFLWTIEHTNKSLDNSMQGFAHHGLRQAYNGIVFLTKHCIELSSNLLVCSIAQSNHSTVVVALDL